MFATGRWVSCWPCGSCGFHAPWHHGHCSPCGGDGLFGHFGLFSHHGPYSRLAYCTVEKRRIDISILLLLLFNDNNKNNNNSSSSSSSSNNSNNHD